MDRVQQAQEDLMSMYHSNRPPQTATEMHPAVGALVSVRFENVQVACKVLDVKKTYQLRLLVMPLSGSGSQWVELPRITARLDGDASLMNLQGER